MKNLFIDQHFYPESSFIDYISIGLNFNILEIKMKNDPIKYIYEIMDKSDVWNIRALYYNQRFEYIGKFYNHLKKENRIILKDKIG